MARKHISICTILFVGIISFNAITTTLFAQTKSTQRPKHWSEDPNASQSDINIGANNDFAKADAQLNKIYQRILQLYKEDKLFLAKLKKTQQAWIAFRDAEFEARFPLAPNENPTEKYGSCYPMCYGLVMAELTNQRINQLKKWADGIEEGDVCSGSYRIKE